MHTVHAHTAYMYPGLETWICYVSMCLGQGLYGELFLGSALNRASCGKYNLFLRFCASMYVPVDLSSSPLP